MGQARGEPPLALHGHRESDEQEKRRRRRKMRLQKRQGKWGRKELRSKKCRSLKEEEEELKTSLYEEKRIFGRNQCRSLQAEEEDQR